MDAKWEAEGTLTGENSDKWEVIRSLTAQGRRLDVVGTGPDAELSRIQDLRWVDGYTEAHACAWHVCQLSLSDPQLPAV
jgi:hypothetical protein